MSIPAASGFNSGKTADFSTFLFRFALHMRIHAKASQVANTGILLNGIVAKRDVTTVLIAKPGATLEKRAD